MKYTILIAMTVSVLLTCGAGRAGAQTHTSPAAGLGMQETITRRDPNVVFILMDDMGYSDVGCYGAKRVKTPHIDRIIRDIETCKDRPFFLYYAHNYPHTPYKPGRRFAGSSRDGDRGDVIQELDWSVGEIVKALKQHNILENTLIVFTSYNGPVRNEYASPYRGTKYVSLEGGHRVPFILYWKGRITEPGVSDVPVNAMDLFPTFCDIIGEPLPDDRTYDGTSLTPLFDQRPLTRKREEPFCYYNCENLQAVRVKNWKLHLPRTEEQLPFWKCL